MRPELAPYLVPHKGQPPLLFHESDSAIRLCKMTENSQFCSRMPAHCQPSSHFLKRGPIRPQRSLARQSLQNNGRCLRYLSTLIRRLSPCTTVRQTVRTSFKRTTLCVAEIDLAKEHSLMRMCLPPTDRLQTHVPSAFERTDAVIEDDPVCDYSCCPLREQLDKAVNIFASSLERHPLESCFLAPLLPFSACDLAIDSKRSHILDCNYLSIPSFRKNTNPKPAKAPSANIDNRIVQSVI
jgi:hypothetical protein